MIRKQQKGSLLIEMMAVIALLTLVTPILFQQVHRRNEEIINAQIATEMRMVKEAVTTYLEAEEDHIARDICPNLWSTTQQMYVGNNGAVEQCIKPVSETSKYNQMIVDIVGDPDNNIAGKYFPSNADPDIIKDYYIIPYGYTVRTSCDTNTPDPDDAGNGCIFRPVLFALIVQKNLSSSLRQTSKAAALIGTEGGVALFDQNQISGIRGSWNFTLDEIQGTNFGSTTGKYAIAAVTFFNNIASSSILKDIRWQHVHATTAQAETIAGERIAATEVFTVDKADNSSTNDCITNYGNKAVDIKDNSNNPECDPLFEVSSITGAVRTAAPIRSGIGTTTFDCTRLKQYECQTLVGLCGWSSTNQVCTGGTVTANCASYNSRQKMCNAAPGCSYDTAQSKCLACSEFTTKRLCERDGSGCAWIEDRVKQANGWTKEFRCVGEYLLDPSKRSVMSNIAVTDDIVMASRGNKAVAAALPNDVLMGKGIACTYLDGTGTICDPFLNQDPNNSDKPQSALKTNCYCDTSAGNCSYENTGVARRVTYQFGSCEAMKNVQYNQNTDMLRFCTITGANCTNNASICENGDPSNVCADASEFDVCLNFCSVKLYNACINPGTYSSKGVSTHCSNINAACRQACIAWTATVVQSFGSWANVRGEAVKACYLIEGFCVLQTEVDRKSETKGTECPDPQHYVYSMRPRVKFISANTDAYPTASHLDRTWRINLGGASSVEVDEYCELKHWE